MRLPDQIKECVCFLSVQYTGGPQAGQYHTIGTGLFVAVNEGDWDFPYLVTAKHILDGAKKNFGTLYARMNTVDGGYKYVDVGFNWFTYSDEHDIDVAATAIMLPPEVFKYQILPIRMIATDEKIAEHRIGIGDDVFATGLFIRRAGNQHNMPIVRMGHVAAMPEEPLPGKSGKQFMAYLIEMLSIGGLSGSPVYVHLSHDRLFDPKIPEKKQWMFFLLGLVRGHWNLNEVEFSDAQNDILNDVAPGARAEKLNTGIAVVTPAQYIHTLLMSEPVRRIRLESVAMTEKKTHPTTIPGLRIQQKHR